MQIDKGIVGKIAHLARLEFEDKEEEAMINDLNGILNWMEKLNEIDTSDVEPLTNMSYEMNVFRNDEVKEHLTHERGLKNAPDKDSDYFRVPKVLE